MVGMWGEQQGRKHVAALTLDLESGRVHAVGMVRENTEREFRGERLARGLERRLGKKHGIDLGCCQAELLQDGIVDGVEEALITMGCKQRGKLRGLPRRRSENRPGGQEAAVGIGECYGEYLKGTWPVGETCQVYLGGTGGWTAKLVWGLVGGQ